MFAHLLKFRLTDNDSSRAVACTSARIKQRIRWILLGHTVQSSSGAAEEKAARRGAGVRTNQSPGCPTARSESASKRISLPRPVTDLRLDICGPLLALLVASVASTVRSRLTDLAGQFIAIIDCGSKADYQRCHLMTFRLAHTKKQSWNHLTSAVSSRREPEHVGDGTAGAHQDVLRSSLPYGAALVKNIPFLASK